METTADGLGILKGGGIPILPPKLEDAGLEDCALPPESIKEAFFRAANSLKSRVTSIAAATEEEDDDDESCVQDPGPSNGEIPDALLGNTDESPTRPFCGITAEKEEEGELDAEDKLDH